jgi:hypothetical protein
MGGLVLALFGGFGLVFVFTDTGQTQADRISVSFGVPRDWFDVDAVNHYARFGRGVRMLGLALGGLAGFGLATTFAVRDTTTFERCGSSPAFGNGNSGGVETSAAPIVNTRDLSAATPVSAVSAMTTLAPRRVPEGQPLQGVTRLDESGRPTISCPAGASVFNGSRTSAERLQRRQAAMLFFGGLVGFSLASVFGERRAPKLIRRPEVPFVDTWQKTGRSTAWRSGAGTLALVQMFGLLESGNNGMILSVLGLVFGIGLVLAVQSGGQPKSPALERTFSPMYRRTLSDYIPRRAAIGWAFSFLATLTVSLWVFLTGRVGTERSSISSVGEFWLLVSIAVVAQTGAAFSSLVIVKFPASFDDSDARALIADDARRAAAVQRLLGASVCLATSTVSKLLNREVSFGWIGFFLFVVSLCGAVLWWSPIGVSKSTAERWKRLVQTTSSFSGSLLEDENIHHHLSEPSVGTSR